MSKKTITFKIQKKKEDDESKSCAVVNKNNKDPFHTEITKPSVFSDIKKNKKPDVSKSVAKKSDDAKESEDKLER